MYMYIYIILYIYICYIYTYIYKYLSACVYSRCVKNISYFHHFTLFGNIIAFEYNEMEWTNGCNRRFQHQPFSWKPNNSKILLNRKTWSHQHIEKAARSRANYTEHTFSNLTKVTSQNVQPCDEISYHDVPYVIANIQKRSLKQRYKYICYKNNPKSFNDSTASPLLSLVYAMNDQ